MLDDVTGAGIESGVRWPSRRPAALERSLLLALVALSLAPAPASAAQESRGPGALAAERLWTSPTRFRRLTPEAGLRHGVVYGVAKDRRGFVWLATEDGLDRYDGARFTHFTHDPYDPSSLGSPDASFVFEDRQGTLWVGTWGAGLERFDRRSGTFTHLRFDPADPTSLSDDRVQKIAEDAQGRLWIGTFRGLNRWDPELGGQGGFRRYFHSAGDERSLGDDRIWEFADDGAGKLWVATDRGLDRLDPETGRATHLRHVAGDPRSLSSDRLRALCRDRSGALWIGSELGLDRFDPTTGKVERFRPSPDDPRSLSHPIVNALLEDRSGAIWIGTAGGGLNRFDPRSSSFERFVSDPGDSWSLSHEDVRFLYQDDVGLVWVATRGGGVSLFDPAAPKFRHLALRSPDPNRRLSGLVQAVARDALGALWIGTLTGLTRFDPSGRATWYRPDPGAPGSLSGERVETIYVDRAGEVWIGTYEAGLDRLDRATGGFHNYRHDPDDFFSLSSDRVQTILEDHKGRFWVGTRNGLNLFDRTTGRSVRFVNDGDDPESLSDDFVWILLEDRSGAIWVGTDVGGLNRLDPQTGKFRRFRHSADPNSLANDRVRALYQSADGAIWIGTRFGLDRLDPENGELRHFFEAQGLPSATIQAILPDPNGKLWLATNGGLARLDPGSSEITTFDLSDSLRSQTFSRGGAFAGANGELLFGGADGLTSFDPAEIEVRRVDPRLTLTELKVGGRAWSVELGAGESSAPIVLGHRENVLGFEFAALDYSNPGKHRYSYRLEGLDADWVDAGDRRQALYASVPPGSYRFEVRVSLDGGSWSPQQLALPLVIRSPWWKTLGFRIAGVLALLGAAVLIHKVRMRRLRRERAQLAELVRVRTAEVELQKERIKSIDRLVQVINSEVEFSPLLRAVLDGVALLEGADRALALVSDRATGKLIVAAGAGRDAALESLPPLDPEAIAVDHLGACTELVPGVFLGRPASSPLRDAELALGDATAALLAFRIDTAEGTSGYLLFGASSELAFATAAPEELRGLHEHLSWALLKGRMIEELRELNAKKNLFLGIAAHDLRSPLAAIHSYAELLRQRMVERRLEPALGERFLEHIRKAADQMLGLIRDLLDVAMIESGRLDLRLAATPMIDLLEERRSVHQLLADRKGIRLEIDSPRPELIALMDRERIGEVVDNLVGNAIKYTPTGGSVHLWCEALDGRVLTHVRDTGVGLEPAELAHAFEGGRLSARPTGGESSTGLGLLIVQKIVELHGGRTWVESEKGKGSTFSFSLERAA